MISFDHITKEFSGVTALDDVSFTIPRGECHALMGENGAGKSTLGKILAGIHRADAGTITIDGAAMHFRSPRDAASAGIGMVHQELAFCPDLSVAENLCMGMYPRRVGLLNRARMRLKAQQLLGHIGVSLDVRAPMRMLSTAQEQLVQIASAVGTGANILIFDEPTSSLSEPEAQRLFELIESLKRKGVTMIYISHRMPEVFRLCDRLSVLRDGKYVGTLARDQATQDQIVKMMIGRSLEQYFPQHLSSTRGDVLLSVNNLSSPGKFSDVSFDVHAGEIVGFAGLVGSGRSEVAKAIFGLDHYATGKVKLLGDELPLRNVRQAKRRGIGLVPEDRKRRFGLLDRSAERRGALKYFEQLRVKTPSIATPVAALSGGNQQKIALAKWLARDCKILIVDEPTRGVDVGAKAAIHAIIDDLAKRGMGIILISSELPEVLNLSTRILIMRGGRLVGEISRADATQEKVLRMMAGVETSAA